ncbi:MAG: hypothetical protein ACK55I_33080, partial [bacterium]
ELNMSDGGKGSSPRPFSIANDEYSKRWDAIFGRDLKENVVMEMPGTIGSAKLVFQSDSEIDKIERNNVETQEVKK